MVSRQRGGRRALHSDLTFKTGANFVFVFLLFLLVHFLFSVRGYWKKVQESQGWN